MKLELTFPLRMQSENDVRRLMPMARAGVVKRVRDGVRKALDATGWGAPHVVDGTTITITRISPGYLDDDGAVGAAKPARDGVADWLGIDDRDARVEWRVLQAGCPRGHFGTRVTIEDATDRQDREYVAQGAPARVGGALARPVARMAQDVPKATPGATSAEQMPLTAPTYLLLPWDQEKGRAPVLTRYPVAGMPPSTLTIVVPARAMRSGPWRAGERLVLRRTARRRKGGEPIWLFVSDRDNNKQKEART